MINPDITFEKIQEIREHGNADSLEIAVVSNFPCIVRKGEFKVGDLVAYIHDDAKLIGFDEKKTYDEAHDAKNGEFVTQDMFSCTWPWQVPLLKYLGSAGRVRTVRLRGEISMGILLRPEDVCSCPSCCYGFISEENYRGINEMLMSDSGEKFASTNFGVCHWTAPVGSVGQLNVKSASLPIGLQKTDEINHESLDDKDLSIGKKCLVTRKLDGSSTTIVCYKDGTYDICSRSQTFKEETEPDKMNAYQKFAQEIVRAGQWWTKKHGKTIVFRAECCCPAFQKSGPNQDWKLNGEYVFRTEFPDEKNYFLRNGCYGTKFHFTEIVKELDEAGFKVNTVPVIGEETVTKELLKKYNDIPSDFGEGVVLNVRVDDINAPVSTPFTHFKSKSRDYLRKMS